MKFLIEGQIMAHSENVSKKNGKTYHKLSVFDNESKRMIDVDLQNDDVVSAKVLVGKTGKITGQIMRFLDRDRYIFQAFTA